MKYPCKVILLTVASLPLWGQLPTVAIESPSNGSTVAGVFAVTGWALDNAAPATRISTVQVFVDGTPMGNAAYGVNRPDICSQYPGNPNCPNVGYAFYIDSTALSTGTHTVAVNAIDSDSPTPDTGSTSVQITVGGSTPAVTAVIEAPSMGSVVSGTVTVSGWALDGVGGTPINSVQVAVDGVAAGAATYGVVRTDICSTFPGRPGCPNVGYTFSLNTQNYSLGSHVISVTATDSDSTPDSGSASTTVTIIAAPSVHIDNPSPGQVISGIYNVTGWALDSTTGIGTAISSVQILVDGNPVGTATYGSGRPDVCGFYPGRPGCPNVGFSYMLDTRGLTPGAHTVTATATDSDTTPDTGSFTVNFAVPAGPTVTIEAPTAGATVSGPVMVSGWALDSVNFVGTAVSNVQVSVDGVLNGTASYGGIRQDICDQYPGRPGCPFVGFTYMLNTNGLSAGSHTILVTATDTDTTPDTGSASVTINLPSVPVFNLDAPASGATVSGLVSVTGWASPPAGSLINAVKVFVDGAQKGIASYGWSRPDVCSTYPGLNGCPTIGFVFYLDSASLPNGSHLIQVTASTQDGAPPVGMGSATVTVSN
jgi:hypothetical protein